ncbi:MAG: 16S rRNA processing protein RimM [Lachnospiraceae bacterium]|nr:16S rRNA processing protein RimM [Lachnospiraceae bacterium]
MEDIFRIGVITTTHGLKGEVKVFPTTDDLNRFKKLKKCFIRTPKEDIQVEKNSCKFFKNMVILSFKEFGDINEVERFRNCDIYVTRDNAVPLEDDEYYISDVIGMNIILEDGSELGVLQDVMQTGANDVFVIKLKDDKELLMPVIKDCVLDMNYDTGKITVRLMKGMLD